MSFPVIVLVTGHDNMLHNGFVYAVEFRTPNILRHKINFFSSSLLIIFPFLQDGFIIIEIFVGLFLILQNIFDAL